MAADITTVQALADEIARAAFDEGIAHGKGAKNFCGSNGKVPALIDALIAQMQRDAVQPAQPAGWLARLDGGDEWTYWPTDPDGQLGNRLAVVRPIAFADGNDWREAVQPVGYIDAAALAHLLNGHDAHISKEPVADDDVAVYAAPHPEAQALDSARPVTAQEDRVLRNAALRSSTLVAKGKLVDSQLQQPDADSTRASGVRATTTPLPDPQLCKFYAVETWPELVAAMERHINKLQAKLPATPSLAPQRVREG